MMGRALFSALLLGVTLCAQEPGVVPPVWPGPGYDPATNPTRYVFLTREGDALRVYPPHLRGIAQSYVRVALLNQARPKVTVEMSRNPDGTLECVHPIANGSEAGRDGIAREFRAGITKWVKNGNLTAEAPFVRDLSAGLTAIVAGGEVWSDPLPATGPHERMLLDAVRLTLGEGIGEGK